MKRPATLKDIEPGAVLSVFYQADNPNNRRLHVRAIVDDDYAVVRQWSRRHHGWRYSVMHGTEFECLIREPCALFLLRGAPKQ